MSSLYSKYAGIASVLFLSLIVLHTGCTSRTAVAPDGRSYAEAVRLTPVDVDASEPDVAADGAGSFYVVYVEHHDALKADIKLVRLDSQGKRNGEATRVNTDAGTAKVWAGDPPRIAVRGREVFVAWTRKFADPAARGNDLVLSVSRDAGMTFEAPVRVNDDIEPASHGMHSLAVGANGDVIMLWLDERSLIGKAAPMTGDHEMAEPNAEVYYALSKDGGRSFGPNRKIAEEVCPCCKTALLADQEGAIHASWRQVLEDDHRHIAVARSDNGGETFNERVIVSDDKWQISACPVSGAALLAPGAGTLDVLWYTAGGAGQAGLYFARSTDKGNSFAPRVLLSNDAKPGTPSAAVNGYNEIVFFPVADGRIGSAGWNDTPVSQTTRSAIPDAILPSVVTAGGKAKVVFVRKVDSKRSVWMQ